jgi:glycosyltransferase involved in cell wall biosynthesis
VLSSVVPTRVLHVSASFPRSANDSVAPFLLDLCRAQQAGGLHVEAVGLHDGGLATTQQLDGVTVHRARYAPDRYEVLAYRGGGHAQLRSRWHALLIAPMLLSLLVTTWRAIGKAKPDVVHAHFLLPGGLIVALATLMRRNVRFVITFHGNDARLAQHRLVRPVARWIARRADTVAAVSSELATSVETTLGMARGSVMVAPMPLGPSLVTHPLPEGPLRLIAAGRASHEKGYDVLLRALRDERTSRWSATLVTDGPVIDDLRSLAEPLGSRVTMVAPLQHDALIDALIAHHVVVIPSRHEGLGMLAAEALAVGRPIIAAGVGGLVNFVQSPLDGCLFTSQNEEELADILATFVPQVPEGSAIEMVRPANVVATHRALYRCTPPSETEL